MNLFHESLWCRFIINTDHGVRLQMKKFLDAERNVFYLKKFPILFDILISDCLRVPQRIHFHALVPTFRNICWKILEQFPKQCSSLQMASQNVNDREVVFLFTSFDFQDINFILRNKCEKLPIYKSQRQQSWTRYLMSLKFVTFFRCRKFFSHIWIDFTCIFVEFINLHHTLHIL